MSTLTHNGVPKHIGIIVDGNRRWAKKRGLAPWKGQRVGFNRLKDVTDWCRELGVKEVTIYNFSIQNFKRPRREVKELFRILAGEAKSFIKDPNIHKFRVRVRAIGRIHLFPKYVQVAIARVVNATKEYDQYYINLALGYGGREEITDAVKKLAEDIKKGTVMPKEINEQMIQDKLYLSSEPDLIIRTSGEQRTSNFLPWQATYAEWHFSPKLFPDFSKADLVAAINDFQHRQRRFGK